MRENDRLQQRRSIRRTTLSALSASLFVAFLAVLAGSSGAATDAAAVAPSNTALPAISGTAQQGQVLTAGSGSWSGTTPITFAFQWQRCDAVGGTCGNIAGATGQTYTVAAADVGGSLRVVVTATNADGAASAASGPTAVVVTAGSAPAVTVQPNPHGTAQVGQTLTVDNGTWTGATPITYTYRWQRCTAAGSGCANIVGASASAYVATAADVGLRLRAVVTATNGVGSTGVPSNLTGIVASAAGAPNNTAKPTISATSSAAVGQIVTGTIGTWTGTQPITYAFTWNRCNSAGTSCAAIAGATGLNYTIATADLGSRVQLSVKATNAGGSNTATSALSPVVAGGSAGPIALPDGKTSIAVSSVALPERLVISEVSFSPNPVRSRAAITSRFRVADTSGRVVRGALVYAVGLPYNYVQGAPEVTTGTDGYAVIQMFPKAAMPLRNGGALVVFVRARKAGDSLIAGVSTRRLVQVRLGSPG